MRLIKKYGIKKLILLLLPFLLLPAAAACYPLLENAFFSSALGSFSSAGEIRGGNFKQIVISILFVLVFLSGIPVSAVLKTNSENEIRVKRTAYVSLLLLYNAVWVICFMRFF